MSKVCEICGKHPSAGRSYARRGLAKKKGGVGRKITGKDKRRFVPNIQVVRISERNGSVRRARICAKCLRTGARKGTIIKAPRKPRPPKEAPAPEFVAETSSLEREPMAPSDARPAGEGPGVRAGPEMSDRLAEEIEEAYEEEKASEREERMLASDVEEAPPEPPEPPEPPADEPGPGPA